MRVRWVWAVVFVGGVGGFAACSLNPQPYPPANEAADGGLADVTTYNPNDASKGSMDATFSGDATGNLSDAESDASSDASEDAESDAAEDAPSDAPEDAVTDAEATD